MRVIPRMWLGLVALAAFLCIGANECGSIDTSAIDDAEIDYRKVGDLSGVVVDSQSREPVQGATVRVADKIDETDSTGAFALLGLHAGSHTLTIEADKFQSFNTVVEVKPGSNSVGVLRVVPSGCVPSCAGIECGMEPVCGASCGVCASGTCEEGVCVMYPHTDDCPGAPDGTVCNDGESCTVDDVCVNEQCVGEWNCDEENTCATLPDGSACNDELPCTTDDVCLAGQCVGVPRDCDDGDPGTADSCDELSGECQHSAESVCGNGIQEPGEECDWQDNVGCNDPAPVCQQDCSGCTEKSSTLLWDGSFQPTDHRVDKSTLSSAGQYQSVACLAQADSFSVVLASSLPGERKGYAGKFYNGVGSAYECNSNRQNLITANVPDHPGPTGIREVWYGWSQLLDSSWSPSGGSVGTGAIGLSIRARNAVVSGKGIEMMNHPNNWNWSINAAGTGQLILSNDNMAGEWYDWMYHIGWARDDTGFLEIYRKGPGQSDYELLFAKYNFVTEYPQPGVDPQDSVLEVRIGQSGDLSAQNPQTIFILSPKMGTTRADVEYTE